MVHDLKNDMPEPLGRTGLIVIAFAVAGMIGALVLLALIGLR